MTVNGNTVLGSVGGAQTLTVYASTNLAAGVTTTSATVSGDLTVNGNTVLGSIGGAQTLTVYASANLAAGVTTNTATVSGDLTVQGSTTLGATSAQAVTVNAASTFRAPVTGNADAAVSLAGTLTASGNVVVGSPGAGRSVTVSAATTLFNSSETGASVTVAGTSAFAANNNVTIGSTRSNSLNVKSDSTFSGSVTGVVGVQVRAVVLTPTAAGVLIPNTVSFVDATGNTASTNILRLPVPIMGLHIQIMAGATGFVLATDHLINIDTISRTRQVNPNQLVDCVAVSSAKYYCSWTGPVYPVLGSLLFAVGQPLNP